MDTIPEKTQEHLVAEKDAEFIIPNLKDAVKNFEKYNDNKINTSRPAN